MQEDVDIMVDVKKMFAPSEIWTHDPWFSGLIDDTRPVL